MDEENTGLAYDNQRFQGFIRQAQRNADGTISGLTYGVPGAEDGEHIRTSQIMDVIIWGCKTLVVTRNSVYGLEA